MRRLAIPKVIIDCSGHDDAIAIMMAADLTEVLGITTVSGNAPLDLTTDNALLLAELVGLNVEIRGGRKNPLLVAARHAEEAHGKTGLDGPVRPAVTRSSASSDAVRFLIETIRNNDDVWLVPDWPLTNIALAVQQAPDIVQRVAGISIMGGSAGAGNVTPTAEFNVWADPHAAAIVFNAGFERFLMAGLNLTHQFGIDEDTIVGLREINNPVAIFALIFSTSTLSSYQKRTSGQRSRYTTHAQSLAVTYPEIFRASNCARRNRRKAHHRYDRRRRERLGQPAVELSGWLRHRIAIAA